MYRIWYRKNSTQNSEHTNAKDVGYFFECVMQGVHLERINQNKEGSKQPNYWSNYITKFAKLAASGHGGEIW